MTDLDLLLSEVYPHPIDRVWAAIATSEGLEAWLMQNDFEPLVGHRCTFRFCAPDDDSERRVFVEVLEIDAPTRMVWRWRHDGEPQASTVTFSLRRVADGTELTLRHDGPVSDRFASELANGWPGKLAALGEYL